MRYLLVNILKENGVSATHSEGTELNLLHWHWTCTAHGRYESCEDGKVGYLISEWVCISPKYENCIKTSTYDTMKISYNAIYSIVKQIQSPEVVWWPVSAKFRNWKLTMTFIPWIWATAWTANSCKSLTVRDVVLPRIIIPTICQSWHKKHQLTASHQLLDCPSLNQRTSVCPSKQQNGQKRSKELC